MKKTITKRNEKKQQYIEQNKMKIITVNSYGEMHASKHKTHVLMHPMKKHFSLTFCNNELFSALNYGDNNGNVKKKITYFCKK